MTARIGVARDRLVAPSPVPLSPATPSATTPSPATPSPATLPRLPTIGGALRQGASDLYYSSWRVVPVNAVLGGGLVVALVAWLAGGAVAAAIVAIPLAVPLAGLFRLGTLIARGRDVNLSDALDPLRHDAGPVLLAGSGFSLATLVLATNLVVGLALGGLVPWAVATLAFWGLAATFTFGLAFWPLAVDPDRDLVPWRERAQLAALLVLAHPGRLGGVALVLAAVLVASSIAVVTVLTVSVGYVALASCRFVLPAADRLEARLEAGRRAQRPEPGPRIR